LPMIFGVFVARADTPPALVRQAHAVLLANLVQFEDNPSKREHVIAWSMEKSGLTHDRLDRYYGEVFNRLNQHHLDGLFRFLSEACGMAEPPRFAWSAHGVV
jgi:predicted solute-binding protein